MQKAGACVTQPLTADPCKLKHSFELAVKAIDGLAAAPRCRSMLATEYLSDSQPNNIVVELPKLSAKSAVGEKDSVIASEERSGSVEEIQEIPEFFIAGGKKSVEARRTELSQEKNTFVLQVPPATGTNRWAHLQNPVAKRKDGEHSWLQTQSNTKRARFREFFLLPIP